MSTAPSPKKGRRDHYLPQAYLRGFIDPAHQSESQPLWLLDVRYNKWSPKATKQVAYGEGFYDYAGDSPELENLETADEAFLELENGFPGIRDKLIADGFRHWKHHRKFLFRFMQMLRARSPLFFEQMQAEGKALQILTVKEAHPDGKTITVDSLEPKPPPDTFIKNRTIHLMKEEIKKGAAWLWNFDWALRYTDSVDNPFVMTEAPFLVVGDRPGEIGEMLDHSETLLFFPICWQACLFGSPRRFDKAIDKFGEQDMQTFRKKYRTYGKLFLLSPTKLDDITELPQAAASGADPAKQSA
jgi:Protein of unknown function (DUF4238)